MQSNGKQFNDKHNLMAVIVTTAKTFQTVEERVDKLETSDRKDAKTTGGWRGGSVAWDSSHRACCRLARNNLTISLVVIGSS